MPKQYSTSAQLECQAALPLTDRLDHRNATSGTGLSKGELVAWLCSRDNAAVLPGGQAKDSKEALTPSLNLVT